jgi:septal ring factor EnvC (AmiA/AmiB activator)
MPDNPDNTSDPTRDLTAADMLRIVLAEVREMRDRLSVIEVVIEERLKDTRPIWQAINERTERIEARLEAVEKDLSEARKDLRRMDRTFSTFAVDNTRMRADIGDFDERLVALERKPN